MTKIQLAAPLSLQDDLLRWLQDEEVLQITPLKHPNSPYPDSDTAYKLANLQFALDFLNRVREESNMMPKRDWRHVFSSKPIANLVQLEKTAKDLNLIDLLSDIRERGDKIHDLDIKKRQLEEELEIIAPWKKINLTGRHLNDKSSTCQYLLIVSTRTEDLITNMLNNIRTAVWQDVERIRERKSTKLYLEVVVHHQDKILLEELINTLNAEIVTFQLNNDESLTDLSNKIKNQLTALEQEYSQIIQNAQSLLPLEKKMQFAYDALLHRQERELVREDMASLKYTTVLSGWVPKKWLPGLRKRLGKNFESAHIEEVAPDKDETPPVAFDNKPFLTPFEAVTNIYGKPSYTEIDPSPALSLFFLAAFGLALSDAGYGILMILGTWAALHYFRLKREMRKMVRLFSYAGISTTIVGILTGGWFGIDLVNRPAGAIRDFLLSFKLIDPVSDPMTLLLVAFTLGIIQLLFAWVVRAYDHYRKGNMTAVFLDDISWITMVIVLLGWMGTKQEILPAALETPFLWLLLANTALLIATQGRTHKNPFLRIASGVLSLYGLVGFLSDTLSYSRLLALGLATSIIGLVVNLIASMTNEIPVIGIVLAIIVLLLGHTFNLGINTLGAFIHSGRLQFVEFFPKFMEGGGTAFKPFGRTGRYIDNPKEFS